MNTEQAYVYGFIKKAGEYGFSEDDAFNLLKAAEKPGLWANIRAKRARGEKAAKPGDKDYPDSKQWKKLTKGGEYKMHWSKDLHRDITNGRHYPFSYLTDESKELLDAIKNRDWKNFKEEVGDTTYAAQMLAAQATGLNHPVYADLKKFYDREKVWKDLFKEKGGVYHPDHMSGGSNYAKASKILKALNSAGIKVNQREAERLANKYTGGKMEKEAVDYLLSKLAGTPAWQRSEGKNPEGGLNAKGRASYARETGGTLKAPVTEADPKGERAKRQNSFCSRMCGMKRVNTGSKAQSDPDSRINKSLRKWNCKCGEDQSCRESFWKRAAEHGFDEESVIALFKAARCWEGYEAVPGKEPYSEDSCRPKREKKEKTAAGRLRAVKPMLQPKMPISVKASPQMPYAETRATPADLASFPISEDDFLKGGGRLMFQDPIKPAAPTNAPR